MLIFIMKKPLANFKNVNNILLLESIYFSEAITSIYQFPPVLGWDAAVGVFMCRCTYGYVYSYICTYICVCVHCSSREYNSLFQTNKIRKTGDVLGKFFQNNITT